MTIHERFAAVASRVPEATAVVDGDDVVSYGELAERAARVTESLRAAGVADGSLIGLRMPRGAAFIAGALGILGAGCGYVPIDPTYPAARQEYILDDARLSVVVTAGRGGEAVVTARECGVAAHTVPAGTAYVIYTSGSTGPPKGVVVGHTHVLALLDACREHVDFGDEDVWSMFHAGSFDFSVWEMFGPLLSGGQVVIVPADVTRDVSAFADLIAAEQVTILSLVPTVFGHLVGELVHRPRRLPDLRHVVLGGEAVNLAAVSRWRGLELAPRATLANMYGITETTVHVTYAVLDDAMLEAMPVAGATPIGRSLDHLDVAVVDDDQQFVAAGTAGELLVSGASVAYGYLGRPELTAQRFIETPSGRAYRSGDQGMYGANGALYYIGRADRQVQVHGYRIELGEPEAVIQEHPDVWQAAVGLASERGGEPVLTAAYVAEPGAALEPAQLAGYLRDRLPGHLIPVSIKRCERLPVTANGKVDLTAL